MFGGVVAATEATTATIVAVIALIAASITGGTALLGKLKESKDTRDIAAANRELGIIHEAQDTLTGLVQTQREEIISLRAQIVEMRRELAVALHHHAECEAARVVEQREIAALRAQLQKGTT